MNILLGNIVSFVGCTVMVLIGFIKNKDRYIIMQTVQFLLNALSHFLLGGFGGTIAALVSATRNIIIAKNIAINASRTPALISFPQGAGKCPII